MNKQEEINKVLSSKSHLMRMLTYAESMGSEEGAETYSNAVCMCDKKIARLKSQRPTEFSLAETRLRHDIAECGVLTPERIEQVKTKARHRVKCMVIAIIAVILAIVLFAGSGCHTVNGVGRDLSAWSNPYIEHQER